MLQNDPLRPPPFHFDADLDPAFYFDADPDPDPYPVFYFDVDSDPQLLKMMRIRIRNNG